ncbi:hypothetical protein HAX54_039597 [Datura stramonium]|uniref:Uncharacterized protein n=1 Tax=Datura stramonium TaxID=4076 RepID=A0ABS8VNA8_DATST|nr:hypothetical protein [Datura stramonium]
MSSEESVTPRSGPTTPLPLSDRPSCYSSSSASDIDTLNPNSIEEDELVMKLKSSHTWEQEEAVISFRKLTRTRCEETRSVMHLSGFQESQEHAAGALFSLALDDQNKTAIGSNRAKLVKLGAVQALFGMVKTGHMTGRILLILVTWQPPEGRAAMLDGVQWEWLAKEAAAEDLLIQVEEMWEVKGSHKARKILEVLRQKDEEEEEVDWEKLLLNSDDDISQTR